MIVCTPCIRKWNLNGKEQKEIDEELFVGSYAR